MTSSRKQVLLAVVTGTVLVIVALLLMPVRHQFGSCQEAREAGAPLPLHEGDPGWSKVLDPDGDGMAC